MYSDAAQLPNGTTLSGFDICIIGAGAAGIAMAMRLDGAPQNVLVLSNGTPSDKGTNADPTREAVYQGSVGAFMQQVDPTFLTRSRLNMYGGTTNHFWFYAHPMDAWDLQPRAGYRAAAWPISLDELNAYYPDANAFGPYGPFNYDDLAFWENAMNAQPFDTTGEPLQNAIWHSQHNPDVYSFQQQCGAVLQNSSNVTVMFNAHVLQIEATANQDSVTNLACASVPTATQPSVKFSVTAGAYVIATGGIEPVRLLKLSNNLGDNAQGHLGRGFMLHPLIGAAAKISFPNGVPAEVQHFYSELPVTLAPPERTGESHTLVQTPPRHPTDLDGLLHFFAWGMLTPTPEVLAQAQIGSFHARLNFSNGGTTATIGLNWESVPNENSVITLDTTTVDPLFGQPVLHLDWNLSPQDKLTACQAMTLVQQFLEAHGGVNFQLTTDLSGGAENWTFDPTGLDPTRLQAGDHHMGALRMSASPEDGIVDTNLQVHTVDNLYVAGSGVYPTTGQANPTLTIVALALRLADFLQYEAPVS